MHEIKWRTIVEFAEILPDDASVTQAECMAAVEAARAMCCVARDGCISFDLDEKLIEDYNENKTRKRNEMKADSEGRWKKKEEISRPSHSLSSSFQEDIFDSDSAEEMDQKHSKLGAKPNWCAHADWPNMSGDESFTTTMPPWRDHTLWRITTTRTVEGPTCGVMQQYEALLKKHAIEYTKLTNNMQR